MPPTCVLSDKDACGSRCLTVHVTQGILFVELTVIYQRYGVRESASVGWLTACILQRKGQGWAWLTHKSHTPSTSPRHQEGA